jgi:plasmid stabilization system protein ParE
LIVYITFLILENPLAAKEAMLAIDHASQTLEEHPELGNPMEDYTNKRELFIPYGKSVYVLRYCILRVWHGREKRKEN